MLLMKGHTEFSVRDSWRIVKESMRKFLKRGLFVAFLSSVLVTSALARNKTQSKRYNILFIAVDDLKPMLGCYGDSTVISPHIDSLATQGTVFEMAYCQQAVSAPSRASLLTGWRPDKTQVWDLKTLIRDKNPDVVTLPQFFKENGYETAAVGKVFDPRSVDAGHDSLSWSVPYVKVSASRWIYATDKVSTECADAPESRFVDGRIEARGIQLLDDLSHKDKPFFLAVGFKKPHLPFVAPKTYWDLYQRNQFSPWPFQDHSKYAPDFAFQPGWELRNNYVDIPKEGVIPIDKQLELIHGYHACVSFIDVQVGKLLDELQKLNLQDSTIVVLWGDHGWHLGDHAMWAKHTNFEQATRAPLIISVPDMPKKQKTRAPVEFVDIYPTLCDLTGLPIPDGLAGVSLKPVLQDTAARVKDFVVSQYHRTAPGNIKVEGYALRNERYRYVEWLKNYKTTRVYADSDIVARELYDYQTDPLETVSVVDSAAYQDVAQSLHEQLKNFLIAQGQQTGLEQNHTQRLPEDIRLKQNYPNPFNPGTTIEFTLPTAQFVELSVYNVQGQKIVTLMHNSLPAGNHRLIWNGRNAAGQPVPSGVYFYRLQGKNGYKIRKMIVIH